MMDSFSPTFKWIVSRTSWPIKGSCEIEVSHMGKKPISYWQRWEKMCFQENVNSKDLDQTAEI